MAYTLSQEQAEALQAIGAWYKGKTSPYLTLGGYAGTGKTTLIAYLRQALADFDDSARVGFCAYTGKATRVLEQKLREQKVPRRRDSVTTIHGLIYQTVTDISGDLRGWDRKDNIERDLIIVDEASMVDEVIWRDLLSFGIPVLAVGDHGQLPPVGSAFNLMQNPMLRLERIFRQDEDSPIIRLATLARTEGNIPVGVYGDGVKKLDKAEPETGMAVQEMLENWRLDLLVLCGYNHTRVKLNQAIREYREYESPQPACGDRVVCLRNDRVNKLYNGMTGTIKSLYEAGPGNGDWYEAQIEIDNEDRTFEGLILKAQFGERETITRLPSAGTGRPGALFDFGYALTVHKAQGSQAPAVLLFEERFARMSEEDWRRWLYTAVTRAETGLTIIGNDT